MSIMASLPFVKKYVDSLRHAYYMRYEWEKIAKRFHWIAPPSRPSISDRANYLKALKAAVPIKKILILGATPELRVIASDFTTNVTVADFSLGMLKAASHFVPRDIRDKEKTVIANWLKLSSQLPEFSFDVVLGDLVIRQLPTDSMENFFKSIHSMLRPGGLFITRTNILNTFWKKQNPEKIILDGASEYCVRQIPGAASTMFLRLYDHCTNPKTYSLDVSLVNETFKSAVTKAPDGPVKECVKSLWKDIGQPKASWTQIDGEVLESISKKYFEIGDKYFATDYPDGEFMPLYVFRKAAL